MKSCSVRSVDNWSLCRRQEVFMASRPGRRVRENKLVSCPGPYPLQQNARCRKRVDLPPDARPSITLTAEGGPADASACQATSRSRGRRGPASPSAWRGGRQVRRRRALTMRSITRMIPRHQPASANREHGKQHRAAQAVHEVYRALLNRPQRHGTCARGGDRIRRGECDR